MSLDLADASSSFKFPNAYRVVVRCGEKILAIGVKYEGTDPVIVADLHRVRVVRIRCGISMNSRGYANTGPAVRPRF